MKQTVLEQYYYLLGTFITEYALSKGVRLSIDQVYVIRDLSMQRLKISIDESIEFSQK